MSMQNLAIVFGPTLFGQHKVANGQGGVIADTTFQNQVRLLNYKKKNIEQRILSDRTLTGNRNYS